MKTEISAGGLVYKHQSGGLVWLVVKHSGYHKWGFPKGRIEKGEKLEETAVREVKEEAGIVAKIVSEIHAPEKYFYSFNGEQISKTVHYYLMEFVSGDIADHDFETEDVRWVSADEVREMLGFPAAKKTFEAALALLKN